MNESSEEVKELISLVERQKEALYRSVDDFYFYQRSIIKLLIEIIELINRRC